MGIGWLGPSDAMEAIYYTGRLFGIALLPYREGMPRSLLAVGAMGQPVIASDVPGCRTIVEDGSNGLLCEVKNSPSLMAAMHKMSGMSDAERREMGQHARAVVTLKFKGGLEVDATMLAIESDVRRWVTLGGY